MGKSMQETLKGHNHSSITYAECCAKYLHDIDCVNQLTMICLKCSEYLQRIHSWHLDAQSLARQMCQTFAKTKRLKRLRTSPTGGVALIDIKQEQSNIPKATEFVRSKEKHSICISSTNSPFVPVESSTVNVAYNDSRSNSPVSERRADCSKRYIMFFSPRSLSKLDIIYAISHWSNDGRSHARWSRYNYIRLVDIIHRWRSSYFNHSPLNVGSHRLCISRWRPITFTKRNWFEDDSFKSSSLWISRHVT